MSAINLFNLSTETNTNTEGVKEGVHYKIMKDGHGVEHKILNFENKTICPRQGIIELEPMRRNFNSDKSRQRHQNDTSFRRIMDKEYGVWVGIPVDIDQKTKAIIWKKIIVGDGEILDLSIADDAMKWACIRRSPFYTDMRVINGVNQETNLNCNHHSKSLYKAVDREKASATYLLNRKTKKKAIDIAENLSTKEELEDYARNFGISTNGLSLIALQVEVIKYAESEPDKFMAVHNSDTRVELTVLNRAIGMGVVSTHFENGINYDGVTLGFNTQEALKYLKDNPQRTAAIDAVCRRNDKESDASMSIKKEPLSVDDANIEIANLKRELAEKNKLLHQANDKVLEVKLNNDVNAINPEYAELLKEAKQLDIKGCHMIRDVEKLKQKIAEKKALTKN